MSPKGRRERADGIGRLNLAVAACRRCPRLVEFREGVPPRAAFRNQEYWRRGVPGFGDIDAKIVVVGLAPAAHGGNRTGRVFTGDRSAAFLMRSLYDAGLANKPESLSKDDGLLLKGCYMTAAVKCVPPGDRPTREEFLACSGYLDSEMSLLTQAQAVLALGHLAFASTLRWAATKGAQTAGVKFEHARGFAFEGLPCVWACYHPSPRNTNTGKLTRAMLTGVLRKAIEGANRGED